MGRRGPAPKPTALKLLQGNPGRRPIKANEPKPKGGRPSCPQWLSPEARKHWRQIVPQLDAMGVLTKIDRDALAIYCDTWAQWRKLRDFIDANGVAHPVFDEDEQGNKRLRMMRAFPHVRIALDLLSVINRYHREFGLTPSARSSLSIEAQNEPGPLAKRFGFGA